MQASPLEGAVCRVGVSAEKDTMRHKVRPPRVAIGRLLGLGLTMGSCASGQADRLPLIGLPGPVYEEPSPPRSDERRDGGATAGPGPAPSAPTTGNPGRE